MCAPRGRPTDQRSAAPWALTGSAAAPEPQRQKGTTFGHGTARGVSCSALLGCAPPMLRTPAPEFSDRLVLRHLRGFSLDLGGNPLGKRNLAGDVAPRGRVGLVDLGKLLLGEAPRRTNKRGPQATVNECHLPIDEAAHEDILALTNCPREFKDLVAPRMRPPAPANGPPRDCDCQRWHWAGRRLKDDTVLAYEFCSLSRRHLEFLRAAQRLGVQLRDRCLRPG